MAVCLSGIMNYFRRKLTNKDKDNQITSKNINMINTIIVASVKYILEQKCMEPELDSDILTRDLMNIIEYTISK